jgi:fructokinase
MIVVAGEALIDLLIQPNGEVKAVLGGGPFNAARAIARLGHPCRFVGRLSSDRFGTMLAAELSADGVEPGAAPCHEPTTLAAAELDDHGAASYRFYLDGTSAPSLLPKHLQPLDASSDIAAVHLGTLALFIEPCATTLMHWLQGRTSTVLTMVDLNCRPLAFSDNAAYRRNLLAFASIAHVVKASTEDLEFLVPDADPYQTAHELLSDTTQAVLVTDGSRPATIVHRSGRRLIPVPKVDVVDTVGAGDVFGAGFLTWWIDGGRGVTELNDLDALVQAAGIGVSASAITCTRPGAQPPRRDELPTW